MLGFGWLALREAQEALTTGRLEEAQRLAKGDPEAGSKNGARLELLAKLVDDYERERFKFRKPDTEITKAKIRSKKRKAKFEFEATGKAKGFQCQLKRKHHRAHAFKKCTSPKKYKHLKPGKYTFKVRATGPGGHDSTPAKKKFKIKR